MNSAIDPAFVDGLTLDVLAARHPDAAAYLPAALADEVAAGRVRCDEHGCYRLIPSAFGPGQVAALATLDDNRAPPLLASTPTTGASAAARPGQPRRRARPGRKEAVMTTTVEEAITTTVEEAVTTTVGGYPATVRVLGPTKLRLLDVHPYAGRFRVLKGDERKRLRASMEIAYDEAHPIIVWAANEQIVDGRNRRDLACQLELPGVHVAYVEFPDEPAVLQYVIAQNLARRHLTLEERAKVAGKLVINGASTRRAAKVAGVSKDTAQRAASAARAAGVSAETGAAGVAGETPAERTTGADGKSYPATRPPVSFGKRNLAVRLGEIGDGLEKAEKRLERIARQDSAELTPSLREQVACYAEQARVMADKLDALAAGQPADDARPKLVEAPRAAAG